MLKKKLKEQSNPFHEKNLAGDLTCPMDIIHAPSEPVPRLIRMLVSDWAQSEARICRAGFAIFLYRRVHMQTVLFAVRLV